MLQMCIRDRDNPMTTLEFAERAGEIPLLFQPGTSWKYGIYADILGAVIEKAAHKLSLIHISFDLNLGLGTARTKENLITKYKELGRLDTGIFGTPVLVERLFREGEADLAFTMLAKDVYKRQEYQTLTPFAGQVYPQSTGIMHGSMMITDALSLIHI